MLFYHRIFRTGVSQSVEYVIFTFVALVVIWGISYFIAFWFGCGVNFHYLWSSVEDQLKCHVDFSMLDMSLAISDVIMDVICFVFPIPLVHTESVFTFTLTNNFKVWRLSMSIANKLAVLTVFALGAAYV